MPQWKRKSQKGMKKRPKKANYKQPSKAKRAIAVKSDKNINSAHKNNNNNLEMSKNTRKLQTTRPAKKTRKFSMTSVNKGEQTEISKDLWQTESERQNDTVNTNYSCNSKSCSQLGINTKRSSPRKRKDSKNDDNPKGKRLDIQGMEKEAQIGDTNCRELRNRSQSGSEGQNDTVKTNYSPTDRSCSELGTNTKRSSPRKRKNSKNDDNPRGKRLDIQGKEKEAQIGDTNCRELRNRSQSGSEEQNGTVKTNYSPTDRSCSAELGTNTKRSSPRKMKNSKNDDNSRRKRLDIQGKEKEAQIGDTNCRELRNRSQSGSEGQNDTVKTNCSPTDRSCSELGSKSSPRKRKNSENDDNPGKKKLSLDLQEEESAVISDDVTLSPDMSDLEDSDDDDLPDCFESTPTKCWNQITPGDLVWAKAPRHPHWPAIVQSIKRYRATVVFMSEHHKENSFPIKNAKTLKPYSCPERHKYIEEAMKCEATKNDFQRVMQRAEDYQLERVLRKKDINKSLFQDEKSASSADDSLYFEESLHSPTVGPPSDEDSEGGSLDDAGEATIEVEEVEDADITEKKLEYEKKSLRIAKYIKRCKTKDHLINIFKGTTKTERHDLFHKMNKSARATLVNLGGHGPILSEDLLQEICDHIKTVFDEYCRSSDLPEVGTSYILSVSLPEAIIFAIKQTRRVGKKKAEAIFFEEQLEVTELEGGSIPRIPLDEDTRSRTISRAFRVLESSPS